MGVNGWMSVGKFVFPKASWKPYMTCSWRIGPFWGPMDIICFWHKFWNKGCKCKFNSLFINVWCLTECGCHWMYLQVLLIMWFGYWWSLDFVDSLNLIIWHNQYVLVMIEYFLKWLELVPLLNQNNEKIVYAFKNKMFSRFGASIKTSGYPRPSVTVRCPCIVLLNSPYFLFKKKAIAWVGSLPMDLLEKFAQKK
jgi:hypothetical protein